MPKRGLEPLRAIKCSLAPQASVSANSTTSAHMRGGYCFGTSVAGVCCPGVFSAGAAAGASVLAGAVTPLTAEGASRPEKIQRPSDVSMKTTAQIVVIFDMRLCVLRGPNAVWLPPPPNAPARSAAFPDWRRMATIRTRHTITWTIVNKAVTLIHFLVSPDRLLDDLPERSRLQRGASDEKPVDVRFP